MNKYMLHPGDYAIGENEKLYSDMAAKGWLLEKRGAHLSRFQRAQPEQLRYRIELSSPDILNGEVELPEEQLALYEECGWSYVTGRVWIHIFSAPEGSDTPEIYTDPRQQAATLKSLRRQYYFSWIPVALALMLNIFMGAMIAGYEGSYLGKLASALILVWMKHTAITSLYAFAALWSIYATLRGAIYISKLHRRLKRGQPIDHAPKNRRLPHRIMSFFMLFCCTACAVLTVVQWAQNEKYDMPYEADGPYLLLKDLGWDGARSQKFSDQTSFVERKHSLVANQWYTYECVSAEDSGYNWLYQDIYELRDKALASDIVPLLMADSTFTHDISGFKRVDVAGLDEAYKGHMEYIAVKANVVYYLTYSDPDVYTEQGTQIDVLAKLADLLTGNVDSRLRGNDMRETRE